MSIDICSTGNFSGGAGVEVLQNSITGNSRNAVPPKNTGQRKMVIGGGDSERTASAILTQMLGGSELLEVLAR